MRKSVRLVITVVSIGAAVLMAGVASSSETITYTYDAKGRVVKVTHSGSVNNGVVSNYTYDAADNRNRVTVSGAP